MSDISLTSNDELSFSGVRDTFTYGRRAGNRIDQSGFSRREKFYCLETRYLISMEMALTVHEKAFTIPKTISNCKKYKI